MFDDLPPLRPYVRCLPSADPKMWKGSLSEQVEIANRALAALEEDVDMEAAEYVAAHPEFEKANIPTSGSSEPHRYLLLDTNVCISHLALVVQVYDFFTARTKTHMSLLIPTAVVNEIDTKKAGYGLENEDIMFRAREANRWLRVVGKELLDTGRGAIRYQRWAERKDKTIRKADDRILDCALFFREKMGGEVLFWTEDTNLAILAGAEGFRTMSFHQPTLSSILQTCGIAADAAHPPVQTPDHHGPTDSLSASAPDDGMQIEVDLYPTPPASPTRSTATPLPPQSTPRPVRPVRASSSSSTSTPSASRSPQKRSPSQSKMFPPLPSRIPVPPRSLIPIDILARLTAFAQILPAILNLPLDTSPCPPTPTTPTAISTRAFLDRLASGIRLYNLPETNHEGNRRKWRLAASLIDLSNWVRPPDQQHVILSLKASEALDGALEVLTEMGVFAGEQYELQCRLAEWRELVVRIRAL